MRVRTNGNSTVENKNTIEIFTLLECFAPQKSKDLIYIVAKA
jgi:hypothetical protein